MQIKSTEELVSEIEERYSVKLSKLPRKKIIFGSYIKGKCVVIVIPYSKIYAKGNGWVDFTKEQVSIFQRYQHSIAIFRLSNGNIYYVDLKKLLPLLSEKNMMINKKEGEHWKLDIWSDKIVPRKSNGELYVKPEDDSILHQFLDFA